MEAMKLIDKDALVAEIKRIESILGNPFCLNDTAKASWVARKEICEDLLSFLDTLEVKYLQEEPVSEDLEDVSKRYALRQVMASTDTQLTEQAYLSLRLFNGYDLAVAHKDGANLQKNKMIKDAIKCEITWMDGFILNYTQEQQDDLLEKIGAKVGDKVKLVIIKEE